MIDAGWRGGLETVIRLYSVAWNAEVFAQTLRQMSCAYTRGGEVAYRGGTHVAPLETLTFYLLRFSHGRNRCNLTGATFSASFKVITRSRAPFS